MKEIYRVEHMTQSNYDEYMCGGYNYSCLREDVLAESAEEAIELVQKTFPSHAVNKGYVRKVADIEAEEAAWKAKQEAEEAKKAAKKAEKEAFDAAHPEIVAERKRKAKISRAKRMIKELEATLAKTETDLADWRQYLAKLEQGE